MERRPIKSSAMVSSAYDAEARVLELEMSSHAVYQYKDVPQSVWDGILATEARKSSVGHYFMSEIRACFKFELVVPRPTEEKKSHGTDSNKAKQVREIKESVRARAQKNQADHQESDKT